MPSGFSKKIEVPKRRAAVVAIGRAAGDDDRSAPPGAPSIVFDVEGTLIDCAKAVFGAWQRTLAAGGYSFSDADLRRYFGMDSKQMLGALFPGIEKAECERLTRQQGELYRAEYLPDVRPFPGVAPLLKALAQSYPIALATSCQRDELEIYLERLPLGKTLAAVVCGNEVKNGKPSPELISRAMQKLGATVAVSVGDTPYDAEAAQRAHAIPIGVATGIHTQRELRAAGCVDVADHIEDLRLLLLRLLERETAHV